MNEDHYTIGGSGKDYINNRWWNQNLTNWDDYATYYGKANEFVFGDYGYGPAGNEYGADFQAFGKERSDRVTHKDHELWGDDDVVIGGVGSAGYNAYYFLGDGDDTLTMGENFDNIYGAGGEGNDTVYQNKNFSGSGMT